MIELETRLRLRATESNEKIKMRLEKAASELAFEKHFDYVLINDNLEEAVTEAMRVVNTF